MAIASISDGTLYVLVFVLVTVDAFISTPGLYLLVNGSCQYCRPDSVRVPPARDVDKPPRVLVFGPPSLGGGAGVFC